MVCSIVLKNHRPMHTSDIVRLLRVADLTQIDRDPTCPFPKQADILEMFVNGAPWSVDGNMVYAPSHTPK